MVIFLIIGLLFQCQIYIIVKAWDLSFYNISEYYASSVSAYGAHAFLSLPRSSCHNDKNNPTLVEVSWFNEQQPYIPRKKSFLLDSQEWNTCSNLQDAIFLDVEPLKSRLWVLDRGNPGKCPPKLVMYNLFQKINYTIETPEGVPGDKLSYLVIDSVWVYVGLKDEGYVLVLGINDFVWRRVDLAYNYNSIPSTEFLAISRREGLLYTTGDEDRGLFRVDLKEVNSLLDDGDQTITVNVTYHGDKLGPSSGLLADLKNGLLYYLTRDYAIVRWQTRFPSEAEHYDILVQSYEILPYVSQLYAGPQNGAFALVNPKGPNDCGGSGGDPGTLERRLVNILKHNAGFS